MKVKHLRRQLDEIARFLDDEAPDDFPSPMAISRVTFLARAFSLLAQIRLGESDPLTAEDEWLLDAFRHTHLHAEFEDAFQRI